MTLSVFEGHFRMHSIFRLDF